MCYRDKYEIPGCRLLAVHNSGPACSLKAGHFLTTWVTVICRRVSGYGALVLILFPPGVSEYMYPHFRLCGSFEVLLTVHLSIILVTDQLDYFNGELNPICHLLALLGSNHILHVSRLRFNAPILVL